MPRVSYGTLLSDSLDRIWLCGGIASGQSVLNNSVWRLEIAGGSWTPIGQNQSLPLSVEGGACNVPSLNKGYLLGGYTGNTNRQYHHTLFVFDMDTEQIISLAVPDYVPIPSLVFLNTPGGGLMVALGGKTEQNGTLQYVSIVMRACVNKYWLIDLATHQASLSTVYVFDIASSTWYSQQNILGRSDVFDDYEVGMPTPRYRMCSVAVAAIDASSFNIYLFGGQNDTVTPVDIWVLSLPR